MKQAMPEVLMSSGANRIKLFWRRMISPMATYISLGVYVEEDAEEGAVHAAGETAIYLMKLVPQAPMANDIS